MYFQQGQDGAADVPTSEPQLVVWGTDVAIAEVREKFVKFIQRFVEPTAVTNEPLYEQKLEEVNIFIYKNTCMNKFF